MAITVDKVDDGLPISVIVPLSKSRRAFFENFVLPLIEANNPAEIIVNDNDGYAPKKRNDGFDESTQPYVFFCDDDILLPADHLEKLLATLQSHAIKSNAKYGYAYSGYHGIVMHPQSHPMKGNFKIPTRDFNPEALKQSNYISTMTLITREFFPRFDESLKRLQDYDIWLTLLRKGIIGVAVPDNEFFAYYLDEGITANQNSERDAMMTIINKHKLGTW
jgi:glycosyltransferase involved in cell wall biosynthesis